MDRSATRRVAPTGLDILPVLDNCGNGNVAAGVFKHLALVLLIILRVVLDEGNTVLVVVVTGPLAIRAARFDVHYDRHGFSLAKGNGSLKDEG